jgi:hypothetical protein
MAETDNNLYRAHKYNSSSVDGWGWAFTLKNLEWENGDVFGQEVVDG